MLHRKLNISISLILIIHVLFHLFHRMKNKEGAHNYLLAVLPVNILHLVRRFFLCFSLPVIYLFALCLLRIVTSPLDN